MYKFYFDKLLLPLAPEKLETKINNTNKTYTLINEGTINVLKTPGLTELSFDLLLPNSQYPFATYESGFQPANYYLEKIEKLKTDKKPFQFIVIREKPNGDLMYDTNMKVSLEDYSIDDDVNQGFDVQVSVNLKQFKEYGTKKCTIKTSGARAMVSTQANRNADTSPQPSGSGSAYTVKSGDCLWNIAKAYYGDGNQWRKIYDANKDTIGGNPNLIYPGQQYTIPA